jgi:flagellar hook-length control protein FliK
MQDDQLGRIALRMVDRAGLIHAVVRTDGTRAAQVVADSLPALIESLSQRGLLASWTSAQGEGQPQQADPRQGQPRRQRGSQGWGAGERRTGRPQEAVFQVEAQ